MQGGSRAEFTIGVRCCDRNDYKVPATCYSGPDSATPLRHPT